MSGVIAYCDVDPFDARIRTFDSRFRIYRYDPETGLNPRWDTYDVADPCRDVARFVVEIKRNAWKHFGSVYACDRAAGIFVKAYFAAAHSAATPRLAFHEAAICLERAKHDMDKLVQGWQQKAEIMLDEGLRDARAHARVVEPPVRRRVSISTAARNAIAAIRVKGPVNKLITSPCRL